MGSVDNGAAPPVLEMRSIKKSYGRCTPFAEWTSLCARAK